MSSPKLSIVLPVRDDPLLGQRCILSIAENTDPGAGYELVVVDASGSRDFATFVNSIEGAIRCIKAPSKAGRAQLLALGAEAASGAHLLFLDERVQLKEGWLEGLLQASAALEGRIGVIGGMAISSVGAVVEAGLAYEDGELTPAARLFKNDKSVYLKAAFRPLPVAGRLVALVSAKTLAMVDPPNERVDFEWAWADFCLRCLAAGGVVGLAPSCCAVISSAPLPPPDTKLRPDAWPHCEPEGAPSLRQVVVAALLQAGEIRYTGERAIPEAVDMDPDVMREHVARYTYVTPHLAGKRVLDGACGSGYGSQILAAQAAEVTGMDRDPEAISICRATRIASNLRFLQGDVTATGLGDRSFDAVVGLETVGNLQNGHAYLREMCRLLGDDGELWISAPLGGTPDGSLFNPSVYQLANLKPWLRGYFEEVAALYQRGDGFFDTSSSPLRSPRFTGETAIMRCSRPKRFAAGMVSIVIPVRNQLQMTQGCLESIRRNSNGDYEIVVIDNGSVDGTAEFLAVQPGVQTISNPENLGFAASVNQGFRAARGEYLLVLNNDTVVTPGWLEGLVRHARDGRVGMVGAVSNYAADQQIYSDLIYKDWDELERAASALAREMAGRRFDVAKVNGLCVLIKREVIQRIGGFDTRFGLGYCEDDDFCVRAGLAGFKIVVARDVFIHHYGSRTMAAENVDPERLIQANWKVFKAKWGLGFSGPSDIHAELGEAMQQLRARRFDFDACYDTSLWAEKDDVRGVLMPEFVSVVPNFGPRPATRSR